MMPPDDVAHPTPQTEKTTRMERAIRDACVEAYPQFADSVCRGYVVLTFWEGGPVMPSPGQFATSVLVGPNLPPDRIAPFLRDAAADLEGYRS